MADLLGEVDTNIPTPPPRAIKQEKSGERRKARALSPAHEPSLKKKKILDTRVLSPPATNFDNDDDSGWIPPTDDLPMSDPPQSSPAAKVAQRKAQIKQEPQDDDDDEDMMEVAHAGAVKTTSVNLSSARPIKKILKADPYPSPASSSPAKLVDMTVDSSSWNDLTDKLNVVSSSPAEVKTIGKIDHLDAVEADGSLNFFWTDYTEVNGSLCLFGKVLNKKTRSYVSCFVKVDNILRKVFFLPRAKRFEAGEETEDDVDMGAVFDEVDEVMTRMKVEKFKIKGCSRKYAFELPDIPKQAEYLKLFYPYTSKNPQTSFQLCRY